MTSIDRARRGLLGALLVLPVLLAACIQGQGPVTNETRDPGPFTRLEVGSGILVVLTIGPAGPLQVSAQANVLPAVATVVSGNTLKVGASDDFTSSQPVTVTVSTPSLEAISMSGGAQAQVSQLQADALELDVKGGAHLTASGSASSVTLTADGGSIADLGDLAAATVSVKLAGGATATASATGQVSGTASGGAHLAVRGDPVLDVQSSGGAEVSRTPEQ